jgi:hypothetical protein
MEGFKILEVKFNEPKHKLLNLKVYFNVIVN